jgi:V/A-type H+-transporting ATPase subunit E
MPLEDILQRIEAKALQTGKDILSQAGKDRETRIALAKEEAESKAKKVLEDAGTEAKRIEAIAKARAESRYKQSILQTKQELINSVMDRALKRLQEMPSVQYRELLIDLITQVAGGNQELVLGTSDEEKLGKDFESQLNQELISKGKSGKVNLSYSEEVRGGGFIIRKGGIAANMTFPALLRVVRDELEIEIAQMLFEGWDR